MLKSIRTHKRSIVAVIFALLISVSMLFFGNDFGQDRNTRYAVAIGDSKISYDGFAQRRRELEGRYRQMFGDNYYQIVDSMGVDLNQQTLDQVIAEVLFANNAKRQGLYAGDQELKEMVREGMFRGQPIDRGVLQAMLREMGVTSAEFYERVSNDVVRSQYSDLVRDASWASLAESKADLIKDKSTYTVSYVELSTQDFVSSTGEPSEEVLKTLYEDSATDLELPERVAYQYLVFSPDKFKDKVEITPEDLEFYYEEHQSEFSVPETVKARQIAINFPKENKPELLAATKDRAEKARERAVAGESFEALVKEYSDDLTTKVVGGSLGTIARGKMSTEFDAAVFALKGPGIAELISTDNGYQIVKIEEYIASAPKPLVQVEKEIRDRIGAAEAPAYARNAAEEMLAKISAESKLADGQSSGGLKARGQDPAPEVAGLTAAILEEGILDKGIVELENASVLVQVAEYKEPEVPAFAEVKTKLSLAWKEREARSQARKAADQLLAKVTESGIALEAAAKSLKLAVKVEKDISSEKPGKGVLAAQAMRKAIFSARKQGFVPDTVFTANNSFVVLEVTEIKVPQVETDAKSLNLARQKAAGQLGQIITEQILNSLKSEIKIDVDPGLLAES